MTQFDLSISQVPHALSRNSYVENNRIIEGNWLNRLLRRVVPKYASHQDNKISAFYLNFCKDFLKNAHLSYDCTRQKAIVHLAQEHINHLIAEGPADPCLSSESMDLERYLLAVRLSLKDFSSIEEEMQQKSLCEKHCKQLFNKWTADGHSVDAFWIAPDLVDLVMCTFIHKILHHPEYRHQIQMQNAMVLQNGHSTIVAAPHLLVNGQYRDWNSIRNIFQVDKQNRVFTLDESQKKVFWWYFKEGLIPFDKFAWEKPHAFTVLQTPPEKCEVQIVTSHVKKENWNILDRLRQGVRHAFLRVVIRRNFQDDNPSTSYKDGEMYSFGYGFDTRFVSKWTPLTTLSGVYMSPDYEELDKDDLRVTPIAVSDATAVKLMDLLFKRTHELNPFHFINHNCAAAVSQILKELDIVDISTETHMLRLWYELIIPLSMRKMLGQVGHFFENLIPACVTSTLIWVAKLTHSIVFAPVFIMLGSRNVRINLDDARFKCWHNTLKPHFDRFIDVLNPNKMIFSGPRMIARWQKAQSMTYTKYSK